MTPYDEVYYHDEPFLNTHPLTLSAIGTLFGLSPAQASNCSLLELGAAKGNNIIAMAYAYPKSTFVGIDLSEKQVREGQELIKSLGLKNVKLIHANIMDLDKSFGNFDYIISHGILSWVPEQVREKMFEVSSNLLNSNGISYLSYNTYPGWKARDIFRDIMLFEADGESNSEELVKKARRALKITEALLSESQADLAKHLKQELKHYISRPDWYFLHDFLAENNRPFYINEICQLAEKYDLQYLSDTELSMETTIGLNKSASHAINKLKDDTRSYQQYSDMARLRSFRRSLFCKKEKSINRDNYKSSIYNLFIACNLQVKEVDSEAGVKVVQFSHVNGGAIKLADPVTISALKKIISVFPQAISVTELINTLSMSGSTLKQNEVVIDAILNGVFANLIDIRGEAGVASIKVSDKPISSALARYQSRLGEVVTTLTHHSVSLDSEEKELLLILDGGRDLNEIIKLFLNKNNKLDKAWINRTFFKFLKEGLLHS